MASTTLLKDEHQRNFAKLLEAASKSHSRYNVFTDFVQCAAITISNTVDAAHREEREKEYERIMRDYGAEEHECFQGMFAEVVAGLEKNMNQDFMGSLFMGLELGDQYKGQFFTPYSVSLMMARVTADTDRLKQEISEKGWIAVSDPTCGAGGLLAAFANVCTDCGINYQERVLFVAQDIDYTAACMCYVQLSLLGCPGYVVIANTLTNPATALDRRYLIPTPTQNIWYTPLYFLPEWHYRRTVARMDIALNAANAKAESVDRPKQSRFKLPTNEKAKQKRMEPKKPGKPEKPEETEHQLSFF